MAEEKKVSSSGTFGRVRFSYVTVWEPRAMKGTDRERYSVQCLVPKTDTAVLKVITDAISAAVKDGLSKKKFTEAHTKSPSFRNPLRDGDQYYAEEPGPARESYKGHMFFGAYAAADRQPCVVGPTLAPIMQKDDFYSGCYGYVNGGFFPYNQSGGIGISFGMNNLMKVSDGERLDGRVSAEQAFAAVAVDEDETGSELV